MGTPGGPDWWKRLSPLAVVLLFMASAITAWGRSDNPDDRAGATALAAVALVLLGIWVATSIFGPTKPKDPEDFYDDDSAGG